MIKIAICDDEIALCSYLESLLLKISEKYGISFEIDIFYTGHGLLGKLETECYNLLFLDIEIPDMSGIYIGNHIRNTISNESLQIAYISSKTEYAMQLFDFRPINFIVKPFMYDDIKKVIDKYMKINNINTQIFSYKKRHIIHNISLSDILYFESKGRKTIIHSQNACDEFYSSLDDIYPSVKNSNFLFIHKSYIVNCFYISTFEYEQIILTDNTILPISQSRRSEIKNKYLEIMRDINND